MKSAFSGEVRPLQRYSVVAEQIILIYLLLRKLVDTYKAILVATSVNWLRRLRQAGLGGIALNELVVWIEVQNLWRTLTRSGMLRGVVKHCGME